jgi:hypothetical protein
MGGNVGKGRGEREQGETERPKMFAPDTNPVYATSGEGKRYWRWRCVKSDEAACEWSEGWRGRGPGLPQKYAQSLKHYSARREVWRLEVTERQTTSWAYPAVSYFGDSNKGSESRIFPPVIVTAKFHDVTTQSFLLSNYFRYDKYIHSTRKWVYLFSVASKSKLSLLLLYRDVYHHFTVLAIHVWPTLNWWRPTVWTGRMLSTP